MAAGDVLPAGTAEKRERSEGKVRELRRRLRRLVFRSGRSEETRCLSGGDLVLLGVGRAVSSGEGEEERCCCCCCSVSWSW